MWDAITYPCPRYLLLAPKSSYGYILTHWGLEEQMISVEWTDIGSGHGILCIQLSTWLSARWHEAITWTNAYILSTNLHLEIWPCSQIWINFESKSSTEILFKNMHLEVLSAKWQPFCLGLNVLKIHNWQRRLENNDRWWLEMGLPMA